MHHQCTLSETLQIAMIADVVPFRAKLSNSNLQMFLSYGSFVLIGENNSGYKRSRRIELGTIVRIWYLLYLRRNLHKRRPRLTDPPVVRRA